MRQLLACAQVPLLHRLFYGVLVREGLRVSEALALTWSDVDLERGVISLAHNKTDDPRTWALDPGVASRCRCLPKRPFSQAPPVSKSIDSRPPEHFVNTYGSPE